MGLMAGITGNAEMLPNAQARRDYTRILMDDEVVEAAFRLWRDVIMLTDRRFIKVNRQGMRGKKVEYLSIPYGEISAFAVETAGTFDLDAELKLWVSGMPKRDLGDGCSVSQRFSKGVDVYRIQQILAEHTCRRR